jgi:ABC-type enterochelin transport system permease subunit
MQVAVAAVQRLLAEQVAVAAVAQAQARNLMLKFQELMELPILAVAVAAQVIILLRRPLQPTAAQV